MQVAPKLVITQTRHVERAHPWQIDLAIPVHRYARIEINFSPSPNQQLVSRAHDIARRNRYILDWRECRRNFVEQLPSKNGKRESSGIFGKLLKIRFRSQRADNS